MQKFESKDSKSIIENFNLIMGDIGELTHKIEQKLNTDYDSEKEFHKDLSELYSEREILLLSMKEILEIDIIKDYIIDNKLDFDSKIENFINKDKNSLLKIKNIIADLNKKIRNLNSQKSILIYTKGQI